MRVFLFRTVGGTTVSALLLTLLSCAHDQQLVSITIQPSTETIGSANTPLSVDANATAQFYAYGNYIHPPVSKNITSQVAWTSNATAVATINTSGLMTATGQACGNSLISATMQTNHSAGGVSSSGAVVVGFATAEVVCPGATNPVLSVNVAGTGTVSSSRGGITCPNVCSAAFPTNTVVTLTAAPSGTANTVVWGNCTPGSNPLVCTITLSASTAVSATFQ